MYLSDFYDNVYKFLNEFDSYLMCLPRAPEFLGMFLQIHPSRLFNMVPAELLDFIQPRFSLSNIIESPRGYTGSLADATSLYFLERRLVVNPGYLTDPCGDSLFLTFLNKIGKNHRFHFSPVGEYRETGTQLAQGFQMVFHKIL